jgi:hypothetical protein
MGKVKSAFEIAMEKAGKIGGLSEEEKEKIKEEEKVISILKEFYQGRLDSNGLWEKLKGGNPSLLRKVQMNLIASLGLENAHEELDMKKKGILAVETLKNDPNTAVIESGLNSIEELQRDYEGKKERIIADLKKQIEMNPQLRMQPVRMPDGKTAMQMKVSVEEAVNARLSDYLSEHEEEYSMEFAGIIEELEKLVQ